jgi:hypothetical protein
MRRYALGMRRAGQPVTYDDAREVVYGEPYASWTKKYQARLLGRTVVLVVELLRSNCGGGGGGGGVMVVVCRW